MQNPIRLLFSHFRLDRAAPQVTGCEPLDDPSLIYAGTALLDDLPLPAYAVRPDGSVVILGGG